MKICLYSPYIPKHFGGGEKYLFDVADVLSKKADVYLAISSLEALKKNTISQIRENYQNFLGKKLNHIRFIASPLGTQASFFRKLIWTKQFDVIYYLTDGSLFFSLAKKNILHIQIPFTRAKDSLIERIKLKNWQLKNTNSVFTKQVIEKSWRTKIDSVHHPLACINDNPQKLKLDKKEKIILNVGRFFSQLHSKKQHEIVKMFKTMIRENKQALRTWKLVLVGSVEDEDYAQQVQDLAKNLPVEIYHQVSRKELLNWYQKASIYWHATGLGWDESTHPEKQEHFGISTVEAMSLGGCPVVIYQGGQKEILGTKLQTLGWKNPLECIDKTMALIKDKKLLKEKQRQAFIRAQNFNQINFANKLWLMINKP